MCGEGGGGGGDKKDLGKADDHGNIDKEGRKNIFTFEFESMISI